MTIVQGCGRLALAFAVLAGLPAYGASNADDLARCAGITAQDARLACYDALAHRTADTGAAPTRAAAASYPAPLAPVPPLQPAAPPAPVAEDPKNFGLSASQQHVETVRIKSEEAHIVSIAHGAPGQATVVLDNGQSWKVLEDDGWISQGNKVTIKRAALGSFLMHTPSHHTYNVSRID